MKKATLILTGLIALLAIGLSIEHFFDDEHYNPGFYEYPVTISLHVAIGGTYIALAIFQLVPQFRSRRPDLHRFVGRFAIAFGLVTAVTAMVAIILFPFSGPSMVIFVAPFACYFACALVIGYLSARRRDFAVHRRWMIRAFAIASAIATQRLILVPWIMISGSDPETIRIGSMMSFTIAFLIHAAIAEWWLRTKPLNAG